MKLSCPNCALVFPLQAGTNDANARRFAAMMGKVPPNMSDELLQYINLFKPAKQGMTWAKGLKRLKELAGDIERERIKYQGRDWNAPSELWQIALQEMLDIQQSLDLPMNNHNYLYKVIAGLANKVEAAQEKKKEQCKQYRQGNDNSHADTKLKRLLDDKSFYESLLEVKPDNKQAQIALDNVNEKIEQYRS